MKQMERLKNPGSVEMMKIKGKAGTFFVILSCKSGCNKWIVRADPDLDGHFSESNDFS